MIIYQFLMCILILIIIPFCMGMLLTPRLERGTALMSLPVGYLVMLVSFELVTIPVILLTEYTNFRYVLWIYTPVMLILAVLGVISGIKSGYLKRARTQVKGLLHIIASDREQLIVWCVASVILIVMLILPMVRVIFDGDDAYYVVQSLIAQQKGTMYASNPYTGRAAAIDMRHALAVFPMWIAYVGTMARIHTTILCHSVLPLIFIPLALLVYGLFGSLLLREHKNLLGYFVIFTEIFIIFGRVSMYTPETFLLARTWQGKSVAANVLIPMVFIGLWYVSIMLRGKDDTASGTATAASTGSVNLTDERAGWLLLVLINAAAGIFSSLAVVLACVITCSGGLVLGIWKKRIRTFIASCLCCIPGILYMLLYLYFTYLAWR